MAAQQENERRNPRDQPACLECTKGHLDSPEYQFVSSMA
jgi:hypothetical protein